MATIPPSLREPSVFAPEVVHAMSVAFDAVCRALDLSNDKAREIVAACVIDLARRGERDPDRLRDQVLREANSVLAPPDAVRQRRASK